MREEAECTQPIIGSYQDYAALEQAGAKRVIETAVNVARPDSTDL